MRAFAGFRFVTVSCFGFAIMKLLLLWRSARGPQQWPNQSKKASIEIVCGNYFRGVCYGWPLSDNDLRVVVVGWSSTVAAAATTAQ